ncbi:MAG: hypothetical protein EU539_05720 [Promethearchaeota archaeon]|nr:MAG: hypothetical protein EU539_05720 [Candidatus Lokiarchaeota archaeon]
MGKDEMFIKQVYEAINELKVPLIDERVYDKVKFSSKPAVISVKFKYEEDDSVIKGFLGLAEYFHSVVIKEKDKFYIPTDSKLFQLESG